MKSIHIDLRTAAGREQMRKLAAQRPAAVRHAVRNAAKVIDRQQKGGAK